jgi:hypothetical protein
LNEPTAYTSDAVAVVLEEAPITAVNGTVVAAAGLDMAPNTNPLVGIAVAVAAEEKGEVTGTATAPKLNGVALLLLPDTDTIDADEETAPNTNGFDVEAAGATGASGALPKLNGATTLLTLLPPDDDDDDPNTNGELDGTEEPEIENNEAAEEVEGGTTAARGALPNENNAAGAGGAAAADTEDEAEEVPPVVAVAIAEPPFEFKPPQHWHFVISFAFTTLHVLHRHPSTLKAVGHFALLAPPLPAPPFSSSSASPSPSLPVPSSSDLYSHRTYQS